MLRVTHGIDSALFVCVCVWMSWEFYDELLQFLCVLFPGLLVWCFACGVFVFYSELRDGCWVN
jgi:formate/nitrite transporter FocA (FNT family)